MSGPRAAGHRLVPPQSGSEPTDRGAARRAVCRPCATCCRWRPTAALPMAGLSYSRRARVPPHCGETAHSRPSMSTMPVPLRVAAGWQPRRSRPGGCRSPARRCCRLKGVADTRPGVAYTSRLVVYTRPFVVYTSRLVVYTRPFVVDTSRSVVDTSRRVVCARREDAARGGGPCGGALLVGVGVQAAPGAVEGRLSGEGFRLGVVG